MTLILAGSAARTAIACGGKLTSNFDELSGAMGAGEGEPDADGAAAAPVSPPDSEAPSPRLATPSEVDRLPDPPIDAGTPPDADGPVFLDVSVSGTNCAFGSLGFHPTLCCPADAGGCGQDFYPPYDEAEGGAIPYPCTIDCQMICARLVPDGGGRFVSCSVGSLDAGKINFSCIEAYCGGLARIPHETENVGFRNVGEYFAMQAHYERAGIGAFERLACALERAGAPESLVRGARRAAGDETAHSQVFAEVAARHGAAVPGCAPVLPPLDLVELAIENAVEGCVRETFGALVMLYQAARATDADARAAFARVAADEVHHAVLALDLARWFDDKLTPDERERVADAKAAALMDQRRAATSLVMPAELGYPSAAEAAALFDELFAHIEPRGALIQAA